MNVTSVIQFNLIAKFLRLPSSEMQRKRMAIQMHQFPGNDDGIYQMRLFHTNLTQTHTNASGKETVFISWMQTPVPMCTRAKRKNVSNVHPSLPMMIAFACYRRSHKNAMPVRVHLNWIYFCVMTDERWSQPHPSTYKHTTTNTNAIEWKSQR